MRSINYLKIEIVPELPYASSVEKCMVIRIRVNGKELVLQQIMLPDSFISDFDRIWDAAKRQILNAVEEL